MQCDDQVPTVETVPAGKRPRILHSQPGLAGHYYEPESPRPCQSSLSHDFGNSRMRLPESTVDAYFMADEYAAIKDDFTHEDIRKGWELFRRLGFLEAVSSYPLEELSVGLRFIAKGILPFYQRIHEEEIKQYNRYHADSGYFSGRSSMQARQSSASISSYRHRNTFAQQSFILPEGQVLHASSGGRPYSDTPLTLAELHNDGLSHHLPTQLDPGSLNPIPSSSDHTALDPKLSLPILYDDVPTQYPNSVGQSAPLALSSGKPHQMQPDPSRSVSSKLLIGNLLPTSASSLPTTSARNLNQKNAYYKKYQCTYCEERFAKEGNRNRHEKQQHDSQYTYACSHPECAQREPYTSKNDGLDKHHRSAHGSCEGCPHQLVQTRPSKRAAACGCCGQVFRNPGTLLEDRSSHIHGHYAHSNKAAYLFHWKRDSWKKSKIAKGFIRLPEVHQVWMKYKLDRGLEGGIQYCWENTNDDEWRKFIELAEFGDFSPEHVQKVVEMAYSLAQKKPSSNYSHGTRLSISLASSSTHSRTNSAAGSISVRHAVADATFSASEKPNNGFPPLELTVRVQEPTTDHTHALPEITTGLTPATHGLSLEEALQLDSETNTTLGTTKVVDLELQMSSIESVLASTSYDISDTPPTPVALKTNTKCLTLPTAGQSLVDPHKHIGANYLYNDTQGSDQRIASPLNNCFGFDDTSSFMNWDDENDDEDGNEQDI